MVQKVYKRSRIHRVLRHGEAASSNMKEAEKFKREFSDLIKAEGFVPQQAFDGNETSLFLTVAKQRKKKRCHVINLCKTG